MSSSMQSSAINQRLSQPPLSGGDSCAQALSRELAQLRRVRVMILVITSLVVAGLGVVLLADGLWMRPVTSPRAQRLESAPLAASSTGVDQTVRTSSQPRRAPPQD